jgi:hypothetical protein
MMLDVERLKVGGEAFVEPDIGPVAALNVVTEPMLTQLVRHQIGAGVILVSALIV